MSTITITYDNVDISSSVIFASASFESQLGAVPGAFEFTVKDLTQTHSFVTGKEITMSVDGTRYFGGFVTQVIHQLAFPVDDTVTGGAAAVKTREFILRGVDWNILFDKRVCYNKAVPVDTHTDFAPTVSDIDILDTFFADYIDLTGDGIDVSHAVGRFESVGDVSPGTDTRYAFVNPGDPWRHQMESMAIFTGAIWYIDCNKKLHYKALESAVPNPLWGFSDTPNKTTTFGFRDLEYIEDATNVVNDALVWGGSEYGSTGVTKQTVFGRAQNTNSQTIHGRWQKMETHFNEQGFFEADGCATRARVMVWGTPGLTSEGDERGLQYPQRNVRLSWFAGQTPSLLTAGSLVDVTLNVFGAPPIELTLPIRTITITFPTPTTVQFAAFLGIQTSDPWSLWKYMRQSSQRTTATASVITSDGSAPAGVPGTFVAMEPTPTPDGSNKVFICRDRYVAGSLEVFLFKAGVAGGLIQRSVYDYTESSPSTGAFTFVTAPLSTDKLYVRYYSA